LTPLGESRPTTEVDRKNKAKQKRTKSPLLSIGLKDHQKLVLVITTKQNWMKFYLKEEASKGAGFE